MSGRRDPVKKNMDLFCKPKTFRNRKKDYHRKQKHMEEDYEVKRAAPYKRDKSHNFLLDDADNDFPDVTDSRDTGLYDAEASDDREPELPYDDEG